jgi:hypothetical protein
VSAFVERNRIGVAPGELERVTETPERERVLRMAIDELSRELNAVLNALLPEHGIDQLEARLRTIGLQHRIATSDCNIKAALQPHGAFALIALRIRGSGVVDERGSAHAG